MHWACRACVLEITPLQGPTICPECGQPAKKVPEIIQANGPARPESAGAAAASSRTSEAPLSGERPTDVMEVDEAAAPESPGFVTVSHESRQVTCSDPLTHEVA